MISFMISDVPDWRDGMRDDLLGKPHPGRGRARGPRCIPLRRRNLVDTSNVYNGGLVEEIIGRWFASRPSEVTDRVVMATKGRFSPDTDANAIGSSRRGLRRSLDGSLRRLGRDHVDLYQIHVRDPITPVEEILTFLDDAVRSGKVNYIGLSNFTGWQLQLMMSTAHALRLQLPSRSSSSTACCPGKASGKSSQPRCITMSVFSRGPARRRVPRREVRTERRAGKNTRAGSDNPLYQWVSEEYANSDRNWSTINAVVRIAREIGATPAQVALRWLADQSAVIAPS
jgi:aryl-alcohol dehydrogenase-like predicted oxidoreductase